MTQFIWQNGKFILRKNAAISIEDRGYLLGHGVFDTMCAQNGELIDPDRHYQRLCQNADVLALHHALTFPDFIDIAENLLEKNDLKKEAVVSIRSTITGGKGERGIIMPSTPEPNIIVTATAVKLESPLPPAKLIISSVKCNEGSPLSRIKSTNYGDNILARSEASHQGADDALMLNNKNMVCCTTVGNIFFTDSNGTTFTPPLSDGVLAGTYRDKLSEKGQITEKSIHIDEIGHYESCFMTNSLIGIRPIEKIDAYSYRL